MQFGIRQLSIISELLIIDVASFALRKQEGVEGSCLLLDPFSKLGQHAVNIV